MQLNRKATSVDFCIKLGLEFVQCYTAKKMATENNWDAAKENKLGFNCLKLSIVGHNSASCRHPSCIVEGCGKKHNRLRTVREVLK